MSIPFTFEDGVIKCEDIYYDEKCGGAGILIFEFMKKFSQNIAQIDSRNDSFDTYECLLMKSVRTAIALKNRGVKEEDLVAICADKSLNAPIPILAGQFLGAVTFALDPSLSVAECVELLNQVKPKVIFVIRSALPLITEAFKACNIEAEIVVFEEEFEQEFLQATEREIDFQPAFVEDLSKPCCIHFSSGTTSSPKPICLNQYYVINHAKKQHNNILEHDKLVSFRTSNWYWISGSLDLFTTGYVGGCRIMCNSSAFSADKMWKYLHKYRITLAFLTPTQCLELLETKNPYPDKPLSLVELFTGGTVVPQDYMLPLKNVFPNAAVFQIYGMTEAGFILGFQERMLNKPMCCGMPIPGFWYKVVDTETEKNLGPNQPGELRIKAKHISRPLFYKREANDNFDEEGFFKTGDLMYFDEEFCFFVIDRLKAVLGWKDYLIYPSHIEKVIVQHPAVENAIVIGIPHKVESERLLGAVVLKKGVAKVTEEEIEKFVEHRVPDHHRLREGVKFIDEIPVTITGKANRRKVKELIIAKYYSEFENLSYMNPRDTA